jgi:hypothetical protein
MKGEKMKRCAGSEGHGYGCAEAEVEGEKETNEERRERYIIGFQGGYWGAGGGGCQ